MNIQSLLRKPFLLCGAAMAGAGFIYGCSVVHNAVNTVAQTVQVEKDAKALSVADDDELGQCVAISISNEYPPVENERLIRYVNMVGYTLVISSSKPDGHFRFGVLDTDDIGAYSGPNGYVMITRGAIQSMRDEAELAGVLAHEITHVIEDHGLEAARIAAQKQGYLDATDKLLYTDALSKLASVGVDAITVNGYDKKQEDAADAGAVELMISAGYDPHSYANYLSHLAAMQESAAKAAKPGEVESAMKKIMATHPGIADRYKLVSEQMATLGAGRGATLKDRFRASIAMQ